MPKLRTGALLLLFAVALAAQSPNPATSLSADDIQAFLKALPRNEVSDKPIRVVDVGGYRVGIYGVFRPKGSAQDAVLHETTGSEVYQILEGAGTLVTGGSLVDTWREPASLGTLRGKRIEGGVSRRLAKGDMVIIPGRLPHWWSNLEGDMTYLIMRPDTDNKLPLK